MKTLEYLAPLGAVILVMAFVLTAFGLMWPALATFVVVGIVDLILVIAKKHTISQWIHRLFPKYIDVGIMIGLLIFVWFVMGVPSFLPVLMGCIMGHLFWND